MNKTLLNIVIICGAFVLTSCGNKPTPEPEPVNPGILTGQEAINWINKHYTTTKYKKIDSAVSSWDFYHTSGETAKGCLEYYVRDLTFMKNEETFLMQQSNYEIRKEVIEEIPSYSLQSTEIFTLLNDSTNANYYVENDVLYIERWTTGRIGTIIVNKHIYENFDAAGFVNYYKEDITTPTSLVDLRIEGYIDFRFSLS